VSRRFDFLVRPPVRFSESIFQFNPTIRFFGSIFRIKLRIRYSESSSRFEMPIRFSGSILPIRSAALPPPPPPERGDGARPRLFGEHIFIKQQRKKFVKQITL